jgi:hypothetical protein
MLGNGFAMLVGPAVVKYNNTVEEAITGKKLPLIHTYRKGMCRSVRLKCF